LFYWLVYQKKWICYATGFIGTPIHELSHAFMCLIFFHKIVEIKLFQIDEKNGTLGYVNHSYNKKNPYQLMGNYFIGIAPILCGTAIIYFAIKLLLPDVFNEITAYLVDFSLLQNGGFSWNSILYFFATFYDIIKTLFCGISEGYTWWIFMLIAFCIALHMNLSGADIKNSLLGLPVVIILLAIINIVLGLFIPSIYTSFASFMNVAGSYLLETLFLSLIFSLICIVIGAILRAVFKLINIKR
jgi:hypothetical protein